MKTPPAGREHVTISVSGAFGGYTVDFREYAAQGMNLVGMLEGCDGATLTFADDLADNIRAGDENYLGLLDEVDDFISEQGIEAPQDEAARHIKADPLCMTEPRLSLDLVERGVSTIIWATGYRQDFSWLKVDTLDTQGRPPAPERHRPRPGRLLPRPAVADHARVVVHLGRVSGRQAPRGLYREICRRCGLNRSPARPTAAQINTPDKQQRLPGFDLRQASFIAAVQRVDDQVMSTGLAAQAGPDLVVDRLGCFITNGNEGTRTRARRVGCFPA